MRICSGELVPISNLRPPDLLWVGQGRLSASRRRICIECIKLRGGTLKHFLNQSSTLKVTILSNSVHVPKGIQLCARSPHLRSVIHYGFWVAAEVTWIGRLEAVDNEIAVGASS